MTNDKCRGPEHGDIVKYGTLKRKDDGGVGELVGAGFALGLITLACLISTASNDYSFNKRASAKDKHPTRDQVRDSEKRLRDVLKDAKLTDALIEELKETPIPHDLLDDPEIKKKLKRLSEAIQGRDRQSLDTTIERLRDKKELMPKKWTDKADQSGGAPGAASNR